MQYELRTEAWAPPGFADDRKLEGTVDRLRDWVAQTVLSDPSDAHK